MTDLKLPKGIILDIFRKKAGGLNISNDVKEKIIVYFEKKLMAEIEFISIWAKELTELQEKRTLQTKDWEFIMKKIS